MPIKNDLEQIHLRENDISLRITFSIEVDLYDLAPVVAADEEDLVAGLGEDLAHGVVLEG